MDSSVVVRTILRDGAPLRVWESSPCFASSLLAVEARHAFYRRQVAGELTGDDLVLALAALAAIERSLTWVRPSVAVLRRASEPFPVSVRALDAIQLATGLAVRRRSRDHVDFATHDLRQAQAALALGFDVIGVTL